MKLELIAILSLLLFLKPVSAQVPLQPGEVPFSISPIYLPTGEINLTGNLSYLNIYWEAYYWDGSQRDIGAICFLDCDKGYQACSSAQNCSTLTPPGKGVCSILNPKYDPLTAQHNVSCTFYDPANRELTIGVGYLNYTFTPINFSVNISSFTSIVGEEFNFPVNIKNQGLFSDRYIVNVSTSTPETIYIVPETRYFLTSELHGDSFDPHAWQQTGPEVKSFNTKMTVLDASANSIICVNVTSEQMKAKGFTLSRPPQPYCVEIESKFKVMPELSWPALLFLMLIASAFIFKLRRKS
jgi:hypothetical protein